MELLNSLFHYYTDKTKARYHKIVLGFFILFCLITIDNIFSFSYYYNTGNKIEQVVTINSILEDENITKEEQDVLTNLRREIINRSTWKDSFYDLIQTITLHDFIPEFDKGKEYQRNFWWHLFSSGWFIIVIMVAIIVFAMKDPEMAFLKAIPILFITEFILFIVLLSTSKLFSLIPIIFGLPILNYILNFFIWVLFAVTFNYLYKYRVKIKAEAKVKAG